MLHGESGYILSPYLHQHHHQQHQHVVAMVTLSQLEACILMEVRYKRRLTGLL